MNILHQSLTCSTTNIAQFAHLTFHNRLAFRGLYTFHPTRVASVMDTMLSPPSSKPLTELCERTTRQRYGGGRQGETEKIRAVDWIVNRKVGICEFNACTDGGIFPENFFSKVYIVKIWRKKHLEMAKSVWAGLCTPPSGKTSSRSA